MFGKGDLREGERGHRKKFLRGYGTGRILSTCAGISSQRGTAVEVLEGSLNHKEVAVWKEEPVFARSKDLRS